MPADRETLVALAERVEKASGPDRELDAEIMAVQHFQDDRYIGGKTGNPPSMRARHDRVWVSRATDEWVSTHPKDFTSSLDAAIALVPEGHTWAGGDLDEDGMPWACVTADKEPCRDFAGKAATVANSVCAAALRALSAQPQEGESDA
jgi:hypothetical protein